MIQEKVTRQKDVNKLQYTKIMNFFLWDEPLKVQKVAGRVVQVVECLPS
jgi:hypothetical protein